MLPRRLVITTTTLIALITAACSGSPGDRVAEILDDLPEETMSVAIVALPPLLEHHGIDPADVGSFNDLRAQVADSGDPGTPLGQVAYELMPAIEQSSTGSSARWDPIDLGQVDVLVGVYLREPSLLVTVVATQQDTDEIRQAYLANGYAEDDAGHLVAADEQQEAPLGAIAVLDDVVLLSSAPEAIATFSGDGDVHPSLRLLVEAVDDPWTIGAHVLPALDPGECGAGAAVAQNADGAEFLVLAGGEDVLIDGELPFTTPAEHASPAEIEGDLTRYRIERLEDDGYPLTTRFFSTFMGVDC